MTGFAPSTECPGGHRDGVQSPVSSCDCNPSTGIFCAEGEKLHKLFRRGERIAHQYGSRKEVNSALADLADHLRVDRASAMLAVSGSNTRFDAPSMRRIP